MYFQVKLQVILDYLKSFGYMWALLSIVILVGYQTLSVYSMFWLTFWTEDPFLNNASNAVNEEYSGQSIYYLTSFLAMVLVQGGVFICGYSYFYFFYILNSF